MRTSTILLALGLTLAAAAPGDAQTTPGYSMDHDVARAQFRAYAMEGFQTTLGAWVEAVNAKDVEAATSLYGDAPFSHLLDPASGREAVVESLDAWLHTIDGIQVGLRDFDASARLAYGVVQVVVRGPTPGTDTDGSLLFIMIQSGKHWKIRSHVLVL